jgi:hypothetical protein
LTSLSPIPITVSIYAAIGTGTAAYPASSPLYTSGTTFVSPGPKSSYSFAFNEAFLGPDTTYFIVPNGGNWYLNSVGLPGVPSGQNDSGYTYVNTVESYNLGTTPAGPWVDNNTSGKYSVSVEAVPEPSTIVMAGLGGLGLLAMERNRRRRKAAEAAEADDYLG